jgi:hypothetical protein
MLYVVARLTSVALTLQSALCFGCDATPWPEWGLFNQMLRNVHSWRIRIEEVIVS